jgi:hypothetical protein
MQIFTQTHSGRLASILAGLVLVSSGEFWIDDLSLVIAGALLLYTVLARPSTSLQP